MFGKKLFKHFAERKIVIPSPWFSSNSSSSSYPCPNVCTTNTFKSWYELSVQEKQRFINGFVENYRIQYPGSKTNVSLKGLSNGMDEHRDSPSVFGIFYNDIWKNVNTANKNCHRFKHPSFHRLLIPRYDRENRDR